MVHGQAGVVSCHRLHSHVCLEGRRAGGARGRGWSTAAAAHSPASRQRSQFPGDAFVPAWARPRCPSPGKLASSRSRSRGRCSALGAYLRAWGQQCQQRRQRLGAGSSARCVCDSDCRGSSTCSGCGEAAQRGRPTHVPLLLSMTRRKPPAAAASGAMQNSPAAAAGQTQKASFRPCSGRRAGCACPASHPPRTAASCQQRHPHAAARAANPQPPPPTPR